MKGRRLSLSSLLVVALLLVGACTQERPRAAPEPSATPSPTRSPGENGLCQPFPDRLIDELLAAYNGRDLDALTQLVTAPEVVDVVAGAYSGDSSFDGVEEWARAAWDAGDRIRSSGYSPFQPTRHGFRMLVTRSSDRLSEAGIERVSVTLNADTDGCSITSLASAGPVQAIDDPCAFYASFGSVPDVAEAEPRVCADGSAAFARSAAAATVVDGRALVWGGTRGGFFTYGDVAMDGLLFDAKGRRATRIPPPDMPAFRPEAEAWTGAELLVVGERVRPDHDAVVAAAYSPGTRSWRRIPFPFARPGGFEGVWTGRELLLWGGPSHSEHPARRGLAYDPVARAWRKTAPAPGRDSGRWFHSVVWTGAEMIVFGGGNADVELTTGLAYDPGTDTWRKIAPAPLSSRQWLPLVWTGDEVLVWGGSSISRSVADGAAYDPVTDSWRKLSRSPLRGRHRHSVVWTGSEAVYFGGYDYRKGFADGAAYDPVADRWRRLPKAPIKPRFDHAALWTGDEMLVFGGTWESGHFSLGDGAFYDPATNRWRRVVPLLRRK
jgi:hypothetical protein